MKLFGKVAKGALKGTLKIDFEDNAEATVEGHLPEIDLLEHFKTPKDSLLVFDDLERCSMRMKRVLGYINALVEHEEFKAIWPAPGSADTELGVLMEPEVKSWKRQRAEPQAAAARNDGISIERDDQ